MSRLTTEVREILAAHPPLPQKELEEQLATFVLRHYEEGDSETHSTSEVTICVLIGLINEILRFRDRYGLIQLPEAYREIDATEDLPTT